MMDSAVIESVRKELEHAHRILVVSHIRPDGDAVGSVLALGLSLEQAGKHVQMVLADGVPGVFQKFPGANRISKRARGEVDLTIVLDCSDLDRTGSALNGYSAPDLNIDHHPTNLNFGRFNLVKTDAVSTTEILGNILEPLGLPINAEIAEALVAGLLTDTMGFRTANMNPGALRLAADLMEYGIDLPRIYRETLVERSFEALAFWQLGLSRVRRDDRLIWTSLTLRDREEANYPGRDDADLISVLRSVADIDIAVIFVEQKNDKVKISWRARPGFNTSKIALRFGGGGHNAASGAEVEGGLEEVQSEVLTATRTLLETPSLEINV